MKAVGFGKRQGFSNKTNQALPQGVEPTLNMVRLATFFAHRLMTVRRENTLIGIPKIAERMRAFVGPGDAPPELQATGFTAVVDEVGDDLSGAATQSDPDPALVAFPEDKGPQLIQFQHIIQLGLGQRGVQGRQVISPVFNPRSDGAARDAKQTLDPPQTDPFQYGTPDLGARAFILAPLRQ
jgi:hypothetical protein